MNKYYGDMGNEVICIVMFIIVMNYYYEYGDIWKMS